MANIRSAKKRARQTLKRQARNRSRINRIRTFIKNVETAIAANNKEQASIAFKLAQPEIHRGIQKGVLHKNTAARKISQLAAHVKALSA